MAFFDTPFFYFILLLITLSYPLLQSFEKRLNYYSNWSRLFKSIFLMMCLFIPWDIYFTANGVWGFNEKFILDIPHFFYLPLEEWLFFIIIPYACVFIYEVLNYFFPLRRNYNIINKILFVKSVILLVLAFVFYSKIYTSLCFSLASLFIYLLYQLDSKELFKIYRAYLVSLIPFIIINGFLTGSYTSEPIVWYNDVHNLGVRFLNIPIEDFIYSFLMLSMTLFFFTKQKSITK